MNMVVAYCWKKFHNLIGRQKGCTEAENVISDLLSLFQIASVDKSVLQYASANNGRGYEKSVIYTSAEQKGNGEGEMGFRNHLDSP